MLGVPAYIIKEMGRWKSAVYQIYTQPSVQQVRSAAQLFGGAVNGTQKKRVGPMSVEKACLTSWEDIANDLPAAIGDGELAVQWSKTIH